MSAPRLWKFQFSTTTAFVIEVGHLYMRFFTNRQPIADGGGAYEVISPYSISVVPYLQFKQVGDEVRITHPDFPPYKLSRIEDDQWTLAEIEFNEPPFLDENVTATTVAASATTGTVTLTASGSLFHSDHVGAYWRLGHRKDAEQINHAITTNNSSTSVTIFGQWRVATYGTWNATITLQRSDNAGSTWRAVRTFKGAGDLNIDEVGDAETAALYRLTVSGFVSATTARATLESVDSVLYGYVRITAVASATSATATVKETLYSAAATPIWAEGAWSEYRGYPRTLTIHEQRMIYGGTTHRPGGIWGSVIDDFDNFETGEEDDLAFARVLAAEENHPIQWLVSHTALLAGTTGAEWRIVGDYSGNVITAARMDAKQQSYYGSQYIPAIQAGNAVLFVERKGAKLREMALSEIIDAEWVANDLTLLAPHITDAGLIVQMAWQKDAKILWCVTADGRLLGLTYNREQQVVAWHEHTTGLVRSVACIYGDDGATDEVWIIVERTVEDETRYYVELFNPDPMDGKADAFFVDSGVRHDGSPVNSLAGLDHLVGETIPVLADGVIYECEVDGDGEITLPSGVTAEKISAGLAFEYVLSPWRLDADSAAGVHIGREKHVSGLSMRVLRSGVPSFTQNGTTYPVEIPEHLQGSDPDNPALLGETLVEGRREAVDLRVPGFSSGLTTDPRIVIRGSDPLPMNILALVVDYSVGSG